MSEHSAEYDRAHVIWDGDDGDWYDDCDHYWLDRPESDTHVCRACGYEGSGPPPSEGCDCTRLCSMGPTCPGGMLAGLPDSGCWRTDEDPYDKPIYIQSRIPRLSHMHSEPVCAFPECETYLTRADMAAMRARQASPTDRGES